MLKTIWTYAAIAVAVSGAGAAAYYFTHETQSMEGPVPVAEPARPTAAPTQSASNQEELKRKTLEGIGSIKKLKPVPLQPSQQR
jgi:hypothetical protein